MTDSFYTKMMSQNLQINKNHIHAWCASLDMNEACLDSFQKILSEDEQNKALRIKIEKPRKAYVAARGILRTIIAAYLQEDPKRIRFQYGPNGKPALADAHGRPKLTFNMSHSHGLALCCVALDHEIGADIEKIRQNVSIFDIAKRFFSGREYEEIIHLPEAQQKRGFFNCWTRKEAYLKATGKGLTFPLSDFDVSLTPGRPAKLIAHRSDPEQTALWSIVNLDVGPDYAAAVAAEGKDFTVTVRQLPRNNTDIH